LNDAQNLPQQSSAVFNDISSQQPGNRLLWTYVYTFLYAGLLLFLSLAGADQQVPLAQKRGHVLFYTVTIASELVILALAYLGIRISGMRMAQVIAGKWKSAEDFLLDLGLGFGFAIFLLLVVAGLGFSLGLNRPGAADQGKKVIMAIAPKTTEELLLFLFLSMAAGVIEEVVFRGFLQIQFGKLARNIWLGMFFSAVLFGLSHAYEGKPRMFIIFVLGVLFGTMAILRKSLRTGMIAHALFDGIVGAVAMIAIKSGVLK
jgi:membrane protease YdiL (CAAX protease family)